MNINYLLEEEEDIIKKIYYNNLDFSEKNPRTRTYQEIIKIIRKQEKEILDITNKEINEKFKNYLEKRNEKDTLEAEEQFKLGFKTAIRIIVESFKN